MITLRLMLAGVLLSLCSCQSGTSANVGLEPSADRLEYIAQIKKIDSSSRGFITVDQATAYYNALFADLDKNGDGHLDAGEVESLLPIMQAKTGTELLAKLDRNVDGKVSRPELLVIVNCIGRQSG
jgi:hypothetical protein